MAKTDSIKKLLSDVDDMLSTQRAVKGEAAARFTLVTFYCAQLQAVLLHYAQQTDDQRGAMLGKMMVHQIMDIVISMNSLSDDEASEAVTTANNMLQRLIAAH